MFSSLKPKTVGKLAFYAYAMLATLLLALPNATVLYLAANNVLGFWLGFYLHIAAFCFCGLVWLELMPVLRYQAKKAAQRHRCARLPAVECVRSLIQQLATNAERAEWRTLVSMTLLFGTHLVLIKPAAHAQMRVVEHEAPSIRDARVLTTACALQAELHLNEHGVIRALKYLRQGYPVREVRNLFAGTVRKF